MGSVSVLFFHNGCWLDDSNNGANNVQDGILPTFEWLDESQSEWEFSREDMIGFMRWALDYEVEWDVETDHWLIAGKQTPLTDGRSGFNQHYDPFTDSELITEYLNSPEYKNKEK